MKRLWWKLSAWFDPDTDLRSLDKMEHAFGGFAVCLICVQFVSGFDAFVLTCVIGFVYECGQADTAHSLRALGRPGFGIGLVDLAYDAVGALILLWLRWAI